MKIKEIIMKNLFLILPIFTLAACDNVDISKYPEDVQECYTQTLESTDNCTKSKKTVVKYCECISAKKAAMKAEAGKELSPIRLFVERQKMREECAKQTGYTVCETPEQETED